MARKGSWATRETELVETCVLHGPARSKKLCRSFKKCSLLRGPPPFDFEFRVLGIPARDAFETWPFADSVDAVLGLLFARTAVKGGGDGRAGEVLGHRIRLSSASA